MSVSLDDAKEANEDAQSDYLRDNAAGIPDDLKPDYENGEVKDIAGHAESLITFSHIARINIQDYGTLGDDDNLLDLRQNLQGGGQYGFDVELTLADPEIIDGEVWVDDPDAEFPEYKVLGDPTSENNDYEVSEEIVYEDDGETPKGTRTTGVNLGMGTWDGQPTESFEADYVTVSVSSRRAADILGALDTAGQWFSDRDGNVTEGLFETPPNMGGDDYSADEDGYPRLTGYPELREDMVGQQGAIAWTFGQEFSGNRAVEVSVYTFDDEDGLEKLTPLTPDDTAYNLPTYPRTNNLYWDEEGVDADGDVPQPDADGGVEAAQDMLSDDGPSIDDLTDDGQAFVENAVNVAESTDLDSITDLDGEGTDTDFDSFTERVTATKAEDSVEADADTLATIIDAQASP